MDAKETYYGGKRLLCCGSQEVRRKVRERGVLLTINKGLNGERVLETGLPTASLGLGMYAYVCMGVKHGKASTGGQIAQRLLI